MRMLRNCTVGCVLAFLLAAPAYGEPGQGTVIYRGTNGWLTQFNWGGAVPGDIALIAVHSSDPTYTQSRFCEGIPPVPDEEWLFLSYHNMYIAAEKQTYWVRAPLFTRVYLVQIPAVFNWTFACDLLTGVEGQLLAEGISTYRRSDTNVCNGGPGRSHLQLRAVGNLTTPSCARGIAHFEMGFHWMLEQDGVCGDPADVIDVTVRGPELKCIGQ